MLKELKHGAMALAMKAYLNDKFREYGEVVDCEIDTVTARISVHALLHGETTPVTAGVELYEIKKDSQGAYIILHQLSSSRVWLTTLLNSLFAGKRYGIPAALGALL